MKIKDIEITPEKLSELSRYAPIPIKREFEYTPIAYRDFDKSIQPVFTLRVLSGADMLKKRDAIINSNGEVESNSTWGSYVINVCEGGIVSWKNYIDLTSGKVIEFKEETKMEVLPEALLYELCHAVTDRKGISTDEALG